MPPRKSTQKTCTECGRLLPRKSFYEYFDSKTAKFRITGRCRVCHRAKEARVRAARDPSAYSHNLTSFLHQLLDKARKRRPCALTRADILDLYAVQEGRCALTGWPLTTTRRAGRFPTNASLDRINPALDYTHANTQLVALAVNRAKADMTESDFIDLCQAVVTHARKRGTP